MPGLPTSKSLWPFSPQSITGLTLWLDAADASSLTLAGSAVTAWRDKSALGNTFTTVAGSPTYTTTTIGKPGVFVPDGAGMTSANNAAVNGNNSRTYFFIADVPASTRAHIGTGSIPGGGDPPNTFGFDSAKIYDVIWSPYVYTGADITFAAIAATTTINYAAYDSNASNLYGNYNTTPPDTVVSTTLDTTPNIWYLGNRPDGAPYGDAYICEFLEFNSYLTTEQRQQVEGYLAWKWGVQTALPSTHPYYTPSPPPYNRIFQPVDISGCQLWLDAADKSSITFSSGTTVSAWLDKSGNGNNGTPNTGITWNVNGFGNGLPAMTFTSTQWFLGNISITGNQFTAFCVFNMNSASTTYSRVLSLGVSGTNDYNNNAYICIVRLGGTVFSNYRNNIYPAINIALDTNELTTSWVDGTTSYISQYGGTPATTGSSGNFGVSSYAIGVSNNTSDSPFYGFISEIIVYNTALTLSQRQQVEAYLAWKWGLRSSLPITHPGYTLPSFSAIFTPKSLPNMVLWLDAADSSTITLSGSSVTQWIDKSGSGYIATPFDSAITKTTLNGTPALDFGDNRMTIPNFTWNMSFTSIMVWNAYYASQMIGLTASTDPSAGWYDYISTANWALIMLNYNATSSTDPNYVRVPPDPYAGYPAPVVPGNEWFIFSIGYTAGTTTITNYAVNGTARTANAVTAQTGTNTGAFFINGLSNSAYDNSKVGEIIHYNTSLNNSERQQVEGYLAWKWGLQNNLPSTHAYKKFRP